MPTPISGPCKILLQFQDRDLNHVLPNQLFSEPMQHISFFFALHKYFRSGREKKTSPEWLSRPIIVEEEALHPVRQRVKVTTYHSTNTGWRPGLRLCSPTACREDKYHPKKSRTWSWDYYRSQKYSSRSQTRPRLPSSPRDQCPKLPPSMREAQSSLRQYRYSLKYWKTGHSKLMMLIRFAKSGPHLNSSIKCDQ